MGETKHEKSFVNYDRAYETNIIGLRGIVYFAIGLFLLVVITFGLMWVLQLQVEKMARQDDQSKPNPMLENMRRDERLPPEPRLQAAPGFGVGEGADRVNLELKAPQSEYWELEKRWTKEQNEGVKDQASGTIVSLPIAEAKKKLLEENAKAKADGQQSFNESQMFFSGSSAGRTAADKRR